MKKLIGFGFIIMMLLMNCCYAKDTVPKMMRVGIYSASGAVSSFTVSSESGMEVGTVDEEGEFTLAQEFAKGKTITIKKGSKAQSVLVDEIGEIGDGSHFLRIIPKKSSGIPLLKVNGSRYRGEIEVRRYSNSDMTVINEVTMQEYLYGVVPREIGGNSPIEAVKAQAIIARTYAAKNYTKRNNMGFNLKNNTEDQAYGGYDWENKNSNGAVDETDGMVATYHGELIGGYYFSTSGGYTESSENVWGGEVDYLEAVPDPYEPDNLPKTTWTVTYSASDIEKMLANKGVNIGKVQNMKTNKISDAGRVLELEIVGTKGNYSLTKSNVRNFLNLYSQWFTVNDEAPKVPAYSLGEKENVKEDEQKEDVIEENLIESGESIVIPDESIDEPEEEIVATPKPLISKLVSSILSLKKETGLRIAKRGDNMIVATNDKEDETTKIDVKYSSNGESVGSFVIQGRGWGHSVGMSQNGAIGMAKNDFSAEEIIQWYYRGVTIKK